MRNEPPWRPKAVANLFLDWFDRREQAVTPLKLQKTLYFCHADFLQTTGQPLVAEDFEAWRYGPVLPSVYDAFKKWAGASIRGRAEQFDPITVSHITPNLNLSADQEKLLTYIFEIYAPVDGGYLSALSHRPEGPWHEALRRFERHQNINRRISNELISNRHRSLHQ